MLLKTALLTAFYISLIFAEIEHLCSNLKRYEIEHHLTTKTPYRVVANLDESKFEYPECKATRIWSVIRHGARNPKERIINETKDRLMLIKKRILNNAHTRFCPHELAMFRFWYFNVTKDEAGFLVAEGEDELIELAERMQKRFPHILKDAYDPDLYLFKYTAMQRTLKSAESFATGLFGRHRIRNILYPEALHKDPVLRIGSYTGRFLQLFPGNEIVQKYILILKKCSRSLVKSFKELIRLFDDNTISTEAKSLIDDNISNET